jgi:hypothetical protein
MDTLSGAFLHTSATGCTFPVIDHGNAARRVIDQLDRPGRTGLNADAATDTGSPALIPGHPAFIPVIASNIYPLVNRYEFQQHLRALGYAFATA